MTAYLPFMEFGKSKPWTHIVTYCKEKEKNSFFIKVEIFTDKGIKDASLYFNTKEELTAHISRCNKILKEYETIEKRHKKIEENNLKINTIKL